MRIVVIAKPGSKEEKFEKLSQPTLGIGDSGELEVYKISVKELPIKGSANKAITGVLSRNFGVTVSEVKLLSGRSSKRKAFEIVL